MEKLHAYSVNSPCVIAWGVYWIHFVDVEMGCDWMCPCSRCLFSVWADWNRNYSNHLTCICISNKSTALYQQSLATFSVTITAYSSEGYNPAWVRYNISFSSDNWQCVADYTNYILLPNSTETVDKAGCMWHTVYWKWITEAFQT